jgi:hypothetical protein
MEYKRGKEVDNSKSLRKTAAKAVKTRGELKEGGVFDGELPEVMRPSKLAL